MSRETHGRGCTLFGGLLRRLWILIRSWRRKSLHSYPQRKDEGREEERGTGRSRRIDDASRADCLDLLWGCRHFVELETDEKDKIKKYKEKASTANDNLKRLKSNIKTLVSRPFSPVSLSPSHLRRTDLVAPTSCFNSRSLRPTTKTSSSKTSTIKKTEGPRRRSFWRRRGRSLRSWRRAGRRGSFRRRWMRML